MVRTPSPKNWLNCKNKYGNPNSITPLLSRPSGLHLCCSGIRNEKNIKALKMLMVWFFFPRTQSSFLCLFSRMKEQKDTNIQSERAELIFYNNKSLIKDLNRSVSFVIMALCAQGPNDVTYSGQLTWRQAQSTQLEKIRESRGTAYPLWCIVVTRLTSPLANWS